MAQASGVVLPASGDSSIAERGDACALTAGLRIIPFGDSSLAYAISRGRDPCEDIASWLVLRQPVLV